MLFRSDRAASLGRYVLENIKKSGFQGAIHPVNPRHNLLGGLRCVARLGDIGSAVDLVVVDSVAALVPKAEIEGDMGDSLPGLQARLMSQALRKLTASIKKTNCMVIFINQIRMKIGVMFGSPETTTGGNALKFYASVRLDIRRTGTIKRGEEAIGNERSEEHTSELQSH